jgi:hypothetical protein
MARLGAVLHPINGHQNIWTLEYFHHPIKDLLQGFGAGDKGPRHSSTISAPLPRNSST